MTDEQLLKLTNKIENIRAEYEKEYQKVDEAEKNLKTANQKLEVIKHAISSTGSDSVSEDLANQMMLDPELAIGKATFRLYNAKVHVDSTIKGLIADVTLDEMYTNLSNANQKYSEKLEDYNDLLKLHDEKYVVYDEAASASVKTMNNEKEAAKYRRADKELEKVNDSISVMEQELNELLEEVQFGDMLLKMKREEMEKVRLKDMSYVVHSARTYCEYGLYPRQVGLTTSNGVFIKGYPQMTVDDNVPDLNVINFGGCRNLNNPSTIEAAVEVVDTANSESSWFDKMIINIKSFFSTKEAADSIHISVKERCVGKCNIEFSEVWNQGHDKVSINGKRALLRRSELYCQHGGRIILETSGQPEI